MKRFFLSLILVVALVVPCFADQIVTNSILASQLVTTSTPVDSVAVPLVNLKWGTDAAKGKVSIRITFTGTGTLRADALVSDDGVNFYLPTPTIPIFSGKAASTIYAQFEVPVCKAIKIRLTATTQNMTSTSANILYVK